MTSWCRKFASRDTEVSGGDPTVLPKWADPAKIKRGQQLFEGLGLQISLCLFCASLPSAYAAAKGVQVLFKTARLRNECAPAE